MKLDMRISDIVDKSMSGEGLCDEDMAALYSVDPTSREAYLVMWAGQQLSLQASDGKAEVHAQIGLDGSPCKNNCRFCSFAACNKLVKGRLEMPLDDVIEYAKAYQELNANLILLLTTASYPFEKLLEMGQAVREVIDPATPLLANTDDMTFEQCMSLREVGFNGAYHVVRMGEGVDTRIPVATRLDTIANLKRAGLSISSCVEPVGPEHSVEEIVEKSRLCLDMEPQSGGIGRRTAVPGTQMASLGMLNYARVAYLVAVYRLAAGTSLRLNCSAHATVVANAGGNLAWAEVGTNPRDTVERTERGGHGQSVETARKVFRDSEWELLEGPSPGWMLEVPAS